MDSLDLLAREDEFKKLNKQLEKKTESLMKEIEHVMQKPDFFSNFSRSLSITPHSTPKKLPCPPQQEEPTPIPKPAKKKIKSPIHRTIETENVEVSERQGERICDYCAEGKKISKSDDAEFLQAFVAVGVQEKVFPQAFLKDNISVENICKFLSSKVKLLQEQMERLQVTLDRKAIQCKAHLTQHAELEGERMALLNKNNNLKSAAADARTKSGALENRLAEKDRLYKEQRSECDKQSCELKRLRAELAGVDSRRAAQEETIANLTQQLRSLKAEYAEKDRLYKEQRSECDRQSCELKRLRAELAGVDSRRAAQEETIANLTQQLRSLKAEYADFRDSTRSLSTSHQNAISCLETRTKALTSTIDKQTALIDNLRKQNAVLATESVLKVLEKDYCNFLDQDL